MFDPQRPAWQNPRVHGILLLVFLSGAVFGALVMRIGMNYRVHARSNGSPSIGKGLSYDRLTKDLDLTAEQCRQLKTILDDYARYHEDLEGQLEDWQATGKNQIMRILTPGQRQKFEQLTRSVQSH
ncbi:MAG TPA: hypothetical protein VKU01_14485 [Bryobacteraceae bacterium]|nr:hypothetical protein [Bryobacteraceae bacterium]